MLVLATFLLGTLDNQVWVRVLEQHKQPISADKTLRFPAFPILVWLGDPASQNSCGKVCSQNRKLPCLKGGEFGTPRKNSDSELIWTGGAAKSDPPIDRELADGAR